MKYKIGDKVKIVLITEDIERTRSVTLGDIGVIIELDDDNRPYCVESKNFRLGEGDGYWFTEDALELVEDESTQSLGVKYDSDKLEYSLLPKGVLTPILKVLSFGKKKYAADNWMLVDNPKERYYNAMQRHITQWWEGEKYDSETGENHLAHATCCLMFLLWFENKEDGNLKGKDNQ